MFFVFVTLIAAAAAAPQYLQQNLWHGPSFYPEHHRHSDFFGDDIFDTGRFWEELNTELRELDTMLANLNRRFPTSITREVIEDNLYKITIPLNGFEEKDIIVKAKPGLLMIQAVQKYDETVVKNYLDVRTLPDCVNVTGNWRYEHGVLKIEFPLKSDQTTDGTGVAVTEGQEGFQTEIPSREEMEPTEGPSDVQDADVGVSQVEQTEDRQILTNEIPNNTFEATTYAVDIKGDVEFVPIKK